MGTEYDYERECNEIDEIILNVIQCEKCQSKSSLDLWKLGVNNKNKLVRLCPDCKCEVEI